MCFVGECLVNLNVFDQISGLRMSTPIFVYIDSKTILEYWKKCELLKLI